MAGKRIIDLPACMALGLTDLMEISQYSSTQVSGKVTLAQLQAFLSNPTLAQVLYYGNVSGGNHIDMTSGDLIRALGNSYNNLTLETSFNQLSAQDPSTNEQVFYQCISGAGGSYTQIKSSDLATGAYSNIQLSQENGLVISTSILGGYSTQLSWSPTAWNIYSTYSTFKGLEYGGDYSANYSSRSLIDKGYATATFATPTTIILPQYGGTGKANNSASTLTISGSFASTFAITGAFTYTFPTATSTLLANNLGLSGGTTLIGGTAVGDALNLKGTSGNGTSSVAAINFLVGNNGATTAASYYNDGMLNIGNASKNATAFGVVRIGQGTSWIDFGEAFGTQSAIWFQKTATSTNFSLSGTTSVTVLSAPTSVNIGISNATKLQVNNQNIIFTPAAYTSTGAIKYLFSSTADTGTTVSTILEKVKFDLGSTQWATGALSGTQPFFSITQPTISFVGSSTATLTGTLVIDGAVNSGANAIQTTTAGLLIKSAVVNGTGTVGTSYGIKTNSQTGATTNYGLGVSGITELIGSSLTDLPSLGAEQLSSSGWTSTDWTGSFGAGWSHTPGNTTVLSNTLAGVIGTYYVITFTVTNRTAGTFDITFGGQSVTGQSVTSNFCPKATTTGTLSITPTSTFDGTIVISIKAISTLSTGTILFKDSAGTIRNEIRTNSIYNNTFMGVSAGARNYSGYANTFIGYVAGVSNTGGYQNTFIGQQAGELNTTGANNTFLGFFSGSIATTASNNVMVGYFSGAGLTTGGFSVGVGNSAISGMTTGNFNTAIGQQAGTNMTTSSNTVFVGYSAGRYHADGSTSLTTAPNSTYIGASARGKDNSDSNSTVIGYLAIGMGANTVVIGNSSVTDVYHFGTLRTTKTTEQLRLNYDASNYVSYTVSATGGLTVALTGSAQTFTFGATNTLLYTSNTNNTFVNTGATSAQIQTTSGTRTINIQSYAGDVNYIDAVTTLRIRTTSAHSVEFYTNTVRRAIFASTGAFTFEDATNIAFNTTTGTKIAEATSQKIAFWNATPIVQPVNTVAIDDVLINTGLRASGGSANFTLKITNNLPQNLKGYTVAGLPAGVLGDFAYVTDALAPTYLAAIVGGGTIKTSVFYDGTNWVAH